MRWRRHTSPNRGDIRNVIRFLWWPTKLPNCQGHIEEVRWLEFASIVQTYEVIHCYGGWEKWKDLYWA